MTETTAAAIVAGILVGTSIAALIIFMIWLIVKNGGGR